MEKNLFKAKSLKKLAALILIALFILVSSESGSAKSGSMKLMAASQIEKNPKGSLADLSLEIRDGKGRVFIDSFPLSKLDTQISTRFAKEVACNFIEYDCSKYDFFYTIRANSNIIGGPSAGAAITLLTISVLKDIPIDKKAAITGTINTGGIIGPVGSIPAKIESAAEYGIKKIVIPKYSNVNNTRLNELKKKYNIEIYEVSQLREALSIFSNRNFSNNDNINLSSSYVKTMRNISIGLCKRAREAASHINNFEKNDSALSLLKKGEAALNESHYYSGASFCFGSGLNLRYRLLKEQNLTHDEIIKKINSTKEIISRSEEAIKKIKLKTLTDLETFMAVTDRLNEAKDRLNSSLNYLELNKTDSALYELGFALERINSAKSWSVFFGKPGKEFEINKKALQESCLKKISEVEERIQYLNLYLPNAPSDARKSIDESYSDYNSGHPELCLYKSSIAKAKIDAVINSLSINLEDVDDVIKDRLNLVQSFIARQNKKGIFPIVAYSYYEYADSLKESDKYSSILYLEYALELSNLDIYFSKKKGPGLSFSIEVKNAIVFGSGALLGFVLGIIIMGYINKKNKTKQKKPR